LNLYLNIIKSIAIAILLYVAINEYRLYSLKKKLFSVNLKDSLVSLTGKVLKKEKANRIRQKLRKAGNPLGLIPETFIITKILLTIFAVFYTRAVDMELTQRIAFIVFAFFSLDLYVHFSQKDREEAFRNEMPIIVDIFELGAAADIPIRDVFFIAAESAESKHVKQEISKLAAEYFMTNDKELCLKKFAKNTGIVESEILVMSLLQGDKTGKTLNILSSLSSSLYNTVAARLVRQDKSTDFKVLFTIFFLMTSIVMLYMYPYFSNLEGGLKSIFL